MAVPVNGSTICAPEPLVIVTDPVRCVDAVGVSAAVGVKVTLIVQLFPAGTLAQLLVCAKSPTATTPFTPVIVRPLVPELVSVKVSTLLVVLITWLEKLSDEGNSVMPGAVPIPVKASDNCPGIVPTV